MITAGSAGLFSAPRRRLPRVQGHRGSLPYLTLHLPRRACPPPRLVISAFRTLQLTKLSRSASACTMELPGHFASSAGTAGQGTKALLQEAKSASGAPRRASASSGPSSKLLQVREALLCPPLTGAHTSLLGLSGRGRHRAYGHLRRSSNRRLSTSLGIISLPPAFPPSDRH